MNLGDSSPDNLSHPGLGVPYRRAATGHAWVIGEGFCCELHALLTFPVLCCDCPNDDVQCTDETKRSPIASTCHPSAPPSLPGYVHTCKCRCHDEGPGRRGKRASWRPDGVSSRPACLRPASPNDSTPDVSPIFPGDACRASCICLVEAETLSLNTESRCSHMPQNETGWLATKTPRQIAAIDCRRPPPSSREHRLNVLDGATTTTYGQCCFDAFHRGQR